MNEFGQHTSQARSVYISHLFPWNALSPPHSVLILSFCTTMWIYRPKRGLKMIIDLEVQVR